MSVHVRFFCACRRTTRGHRRKIHRARPQSDGMRSTDNPKTTLLAALIFQRFDTPEKAAKKTGISADTLMRCQRVDGEHRPNSRTAKELEAAFGVPATKLLRPGTVTMTWEPVRG
jgi:hypothetical protein